MGIVEEYYIKYAQADFQTVKLYHGTSKYYGDIILAEGLLRPRAITGAPPHEDYAPSREDCVYVTSNFNLARDRAKMDLAIEWEEWGHPGYVFTVLARPEDLYLDEDEVFKAFLNRKQRSGVFGNYLLDYLEELHNSGQINLDNILSYKYAGDWSGVLNVDFGSVNENIRDLTNWIEENDPVMKTAVLTRDGIEGSYCLKYEVPIMDVHDLSETSESKKTIKPFDQINISDDLLDTGLTEEDDAELDNK